ncbi:MAG: hypothetical protein ACTHM1_03435 [Solirubrobacteraceae bacterium]
MDADSRVQPDVVQAGPVGTREIPPEVDFVYVMRRDSDYVAAQFASRLGMEERVEEIRELYDRCVDSLATHVLQAFATRYPHPAVDLLSSREIHQRRLELASSLGSVTLVSMDPLMEEGALPLAFSRCYQLGGEVFTEMIPRPGCAPLASQVSDIVATARGGPLVVIEDDFFTGETLERVLGTQLGPLMDDVIAVVTGTKVGAAELSFPVLPAVRYRCSDNANPLEKVDLGDPRDFIVGVSGLVCRLPSGALGRLPYVLPFVSPAARASLPREAEREFSHRALELSRSFYEELEELGRRTVSLEDADPAFALACTELFGVDADASMAQVLDTTAARGGDLVG